MRGTLARQDWPKSAVADLINFKEFLMKKALVLIAIALVSVAAVSAQPWAGQAQPNFPPRYGYQTAPVAPAAPMAPQAYGRGYGLAAAQVPVNFEKITLEGKLELVNSQVAIKKDAKTYYVMIPNRLVGFVDGLKEGASVKVEGYSHEIIGLKDSYGVRVDSLTLNGKTIDLSAQVAPVGVGYGRGMMGGAAGRTAMPMGRWHR